MSIALYCRGLANFWRTLLQHRFNSDVAHYTSRHAPARIKIDEADFTESFLKGSGPGGQKIVCRFPRPR